MYSADRDNLSVLPLVPAISCRSSHCLGEEIAGCPGFHRWPSQSSLQDMPIVKISGKESATQFLFSLLLYNAFCTIWISFPNVLKAFTYEKHPHKCQLSLSFTRTWFVPDINECRQWEWRSTKMWIKISFALKEYRFRKLNLMHVVQLFFWSPSLVELFQTEQYPYHVVSLFLSQTQAQNQIFDEWCNLPSISWGSYQVLNLTSSLVTSIF